MDEIVHWLSEIDVEEYAASNNWGKKFDHLKDIEVSLLKEINTKPLEITRFMKKQKRIFCYQG